MNTHALTSYLRDNNLITDQQYNDLLTQEGSQAVSQSLVESGLYSQDELQHLMALLGGHKVLRDEPGIQDLATYSHLPFPITEQHRLVCFKHDDHTACVLTDQEHVDARALEHIAEGKTVDLHLAKKAVVDTHVDAYRQQLDQEVFSKIKHAASRIRTVEDFGSSSMAMFFPEDHKREIAEGLSSEKVIRQLLELGRIKHAETVTFEPHSDKLLVRMHISGQTYDIMALDRKVAAALYLKLRYLCDLTLEECTMYEQGQTTLLKVNHEHSPHQVTFIPGVLGTTMTISTASRTTVSRALDHLNLSSHDHHSLAQTIRKKRGLVVLTGGDKSGKTFALYQILQACKHVGSVLSLEKNIEYVVDGITQTPAHADAKKNMWVIRDSNFAIKAFRPLEASMMLPAVNAAAHQLVCVEVNTGLIGLIKHLAQLGVSADSFSHVLRSNVVTYRFPVTNKDSRVEVKLTSGQHATLSNYLSVDQLAVAAAMSNQTTVESWDDVTWHNHGNKAPWFSRLLHMSVTEESSTQTEHTYVRALADVHKVLHDWRKKGENMVELERSIKEEQKRAIAKTALTDVVSGAIALEDFISFLRA